MSAQNKQSYANHRRFMPLFHFFVVPLLVINIAVAAYVFYRTRTWGSGWNVVVAIAIVAGFTALRLSALTVQNRVIRLEMMLRLRNTLPPELFARASELRLRQLVGLRFASDAELPALVQRCLSGDLTGSDQIKREVKDWQPDTLRV
jgi:hypothetical protein